MLAIPDFRRRSDRSCFHAVPEMSSSVLQYGSISRFLCCSVLLLVLLEINVSQAQINPDDTFTEELHLTLQESIEIALKQNSGLLDSRLDREIDKLNLEEAEKKFEPKFSVGSSANTSRGSEENVGIDAGITFALPTGSGASISLNADKNITANNSGADSYSVRFTQPLLKGAGLVQGTDSLRLARQTETKNILGFRDRVASLIVQVIKSYYSLIQSNMQVQTNEGALERALKQSNVTQALIKAGRIAQLELTRSQSTIAQRELALLRAKNSRNASTLTLSNLLNLPNDIRLVPREDSLDELSDEEAGSLVDLEASTRQALDNRKDIRDAMFEVENAEVNLLITKNNLLPDLSLNTTVTRNDVAGKTSHSAGLRLSIPLNEPNRKSRLVSAENRLFKARRNLDTNRESIRNEIRRLATNVELSYRVTQLSREARELAERNLSIEQAKFGQGLSSTFEVASSQDELLSAQNAEINDVIAFRNAKLDLHQAMGITLDVWGIEVEEVAP